MYIEREQHVLYSMKLLIRFATQYNLFIDDIFPFPFDMQRMWRSQRVTSMTWPEFKNFLRKSLGDSRAFVGGVWGKVKRESQYQLESMLDRASHLKYPQYILLESDAGGVPEKESMVRFFREGLKPSIWAEMEQRGGELDSWDVVVERAVDAERKDAAIPPRTEAGSKLRHSGYQCQCGQHQ